MHNQLSATTKGFFWLLILAGLLTTGGCLHQKAQVLDNAPMPQLEKLVVFGFRPAMLQGEAPEVIRDPISGAIFMAQPVLSDTAQRMNAILFERLIADKKYELISPSQAEGVFSVLISSDINADFGTGELLQKMGKAFGADAVLAGYIFRWQEREGSDYAVNRPASTAFVLHLISSADGAILWSAKFDKTQLSLSENLFDLSTFIKGKGRWMTVDNLALLGLQKLLDEMPEGKD